MTAHDKLSYLATLASAFRAEGDTLTADALASQLGPASLQTPNMSDRRRVRAARREAFRLERLGDHERAEPCFKETLDIMVRVMGPDHMRVARPLADLARSRMLGRDYYAAAEDYRRLANLVAANAGVAHPLVTMARKNILWCHHAARNAMASWQLAGFMTRLWTQAHDADAIKLAVEKDEYLARLHDIAQRLLARGRAAAGLRLLKHWICERLNGCAPDDEDAHADIHSYALVLCAHGQPKRGLQLLTRDVMLRNRQTALGADPSLLVSAIRDLECQLELQGERRSAADARRLLESIQARQDQA
jgi:hypothetical protein